VSPEARIFSTSTSITLFHSQEATVERQRVLSAAGARCVAVEKGAQGLNLAEIIQLIGQDGRQDLWIEAGGKCFASFMQAGLLQKAFVYLAPKWLGEGVDAFPAALSFNAKQMRWQQYGDDVLCEIRW
jgi:diaminohydroxyphosphoribosylaminopyrimidine deaminase/5-amino-6-(5-phosphoribosylamino)uracil reductase